MLTMISILKNSIPHLEKCSDDDFRVELIVQVIDGLSRADFDRLLNKAIAQLRADAEE